MKMTRTPPTVVPAQSLPRTRYGAGTHPQVAATDHVATENPTPIVIPLRGL